MLQRVNRLDAKTAAAASAHQSGPGGNVDEGYAGYDPFGIRRNVDADAYKFFLRGYDPFQGNAAGPVFRAAISGENRSLPGIDRFEFRLNKAIELISGRLASEVGQFLVEACVAATDGEEYGHLGRCALVMQKSVHPLRLAAKKLGELGAFASNDFVNWGSVWNKADFERWRKLAEELHSEAEKIDFAAKDWLRDENGAQRRKREGLLSQEPWKFMARMIFQGLNDNFVTPPTTAELHAIAVVVGIDTTPEMLARWKTRRGRGGLVENLRANLAQFRARRSAPRPAAIPMTNREVDLFHADPEAAMAELPAGKLEWVRQGRHLPGKRGTGRRPSRK